MPGIQQFDTSMRLLQRVLDLREKNRKSLAPILPTPRHQAMQPNPSALKTSCRGLFLAMISNQPAPMQAISPLAPQILNMSQVQSQVPRTKPALVMKTTSVSTRRWSSSHKTRLCMKQLSPCSTKNSLQLNTPLMVALNLHMFFANTIGRILWTCLPPLILPLRA